MARVFVPALLRPLTDRQSEIDVEGATIDEVISKLDAEYPGVRDRLCDADGLKSGLTVAVDGQVRIERLRAK
ncbi:MAG: molybdopterin synthase sulfur carrier subunit, partial [Planctomycetaceae bacterium]|nr:molybdopterin synthase sulfur carrier subunit [Planctomycetaceae bacterium]